MVEVFLEKFTEAMEEATIQRWKFEEGDRVSEGDVLGNVVSDEGVFKIIAPCSGVLSEVYYDEGDQVSAGEVLCEIEEEK